jgi:hypothetical protein
MVSFFKHKSANSIITNRARYVKKIINVNNRDSHILINILYKSFGHTAAGLIKMGYDVQLTIIIILYIQYRFQNFQKFQKKDTKDINTCY